MGRREWRIVAASVFCTISVAAPPFLVGVLAIHIRDDLPFTSVHLAAVVAGYFAVSAAMSMAAGRIVHRFGARRCMRTAMVLAVVSFALVASARNWETLLLAQIAGGAGNSMVQPTVSQALGTAIPRRFRGLAFGLNQSAVPLATLIVALLIPALSLTLGWRWCAAVLAVETAVAAFGVPAVGAARRAGPARPRRRARIGGALPLMMCGAAFASMAGTNIPAFLTSSAADVGMTARWAAALQMAGSAVCVAVRVAAGWSGNGRRPDYLRPAAAMLVGGGVGYAFLASGSVGLFTAGALLAFGLGWGWSGLFHLSVTQRFGDDVAGATGFVQAGVYVGAMTGPLVFGVAFERLGGGAAWTITCGMSLAAAALLVLAQLRLSRAAPATPHPSEKEGSTSWA
ncbi:MFS transporter [Actinomadura chibensis]|uniref:MFS transporter n=2 Tax=Actinomadura chibensis TaxID=392828 RepID=A0A5D0P036_9ACTN|nr:MFS transporter [Actinomadura chibensis]TYB49778.1 MFS transporter [Actinomadura chibensis]